MSEPGSEQIDTNEKGDRHEREAVRILTRLYRAERVPSIYGNNDPFRLADVMGLQTGRPFAIVQVKTNRFTAEDRRKYLSRAGLTIDGEHTIFEVWVRVDRKGWRMHRYDPESEQFSEYYQTTICDPDKVRDEWAEAFGETAVGGPELVTDGGGDGSGDPRVWQCLNCGSKTFSAIKPIGCTCGVSKGFEEVDADE